MNNSLEPPNAHTHTLLFSLLWSELLPTLTKANADLPSLYFLGATDRLFVIGGNNSENVVTSFCVESGKWGQVRPPPKRSLQ